MESFLGPYSLKLVTIDFSRPNGFLCMDCFSWLTTFPGAFGEELDGYSCHRCGTQPAAVTRCSATDCRWVRDPLWCLHCKTNAGWNHNLTHSRRARAVREFVQDPMADGPVDDEQLIHHFEHRNYAKPLMVHAHLYVFAKSQDMMDLAALAMRKIHHTLMDIRISRTAVEAVARLVIYILRSFGTGDLLREHLLHFCDCIWEELGLAGV